MRIGLLSPAYDTSDDDEIAALVRDGYDAVASAYSEYVAAERDHPRRDWLARLLERLPPRAAVVELGAGTGLPTAAAVVERGHQYTGVDISERQVELARSNVPGGTFLRDDYCKVSFDDDSVDAVIAFYTLTHVRRDNYLDLLTCVRRWLKPDGWFLATFGTSDSDGWLEEDFLGFGGSSWTNSYDVETTLSLLASAGFRIDTDSAEIVEQHEDWGAERWLFVLLQPGATSPRTGS